MEGYCSTGQSPQQAVVPLEEEEEEEEEVLNTKFQCTTALNLGNVT
jgi:hypothetical protein